MKKGSRFLFGLHRITGSIIALFFLMWFVSGLVLVYHSFPRVAKAVQYEKMETLPSSLPDINTYLEQIPDKGKIRKINVRRFQGQTLFTVAAKDSTYTFCTDTLQPVKPVTFDYIRQVAHDWVSAPILKIDTLHQREQWIMYSRYEREMPVYKFYFDDKEKHQLYIAARSGEVLQFTCSTQRFWAWVGYIPHTFYIPFLRQYTDAWTNTLTVAGIIAMLAGLTGLYVGISVLYRRYKQRGTFDNPYRKRWYRWHYALGLILGVLIVTWGLSGALSLQRIPHWIIPIEGDYSVSPEKLRGKSFPVDRYKLDYRQLKEAYPDLKQVEWTYYSDLPVYEIIAGNRTLMIDASSPEVKDLFLPEEAIARAIKKMYGEDTPFHISMIDQYDEYYLSTDNTRPLPVYKVEVDNNDRSVYYIDPATGNHKYLNTNRKVKKWLFSAFHYLNIRWLVERHTLWTIAMWTLCLGGASLSLTGVWLGIRFIFRKLKRERGLQKQ